MQAYTTSLVADGSSLRAHRRPITFRTRAVGRCPRQGDISCTTVVYSPGRSRSLSGSQISWFTRWVLTNLYACDTHRGLGRVTTWNVCCRMLISTGWMHRRRGSGKCLERGRTASASPSWSRPSRGPRDIYKYLVHTRETNMHLNFPSLFLLCSTHLYFGYHYDSFLRNSVLSTRTSIRCPPVLADRGFV